MTTSTIQNLLCASLQALATRNAQTTSAPAAILWPDKDRQWQCVMPALKASLPQLVELGDYDLSLRRGPAIWLKCVIAKQLSEIEFSGIPILYLPGVGRSDLRAIESCARDLQPLAELQYRGVFWSQANGRDWSLSAFLSSQQGGLGLDVSPDKATQENLCLALQSGALLGKSVSDLQGRVINAEWLMSLMAPNPLRDVLAWMNNPEAAQEQWKGARWQVFAKRLKKDFGVDAMGDGVLTAAERLAQRQGPWFSVAELYDETFSSFPQVFALLSKVQPPHGDLLTQLDDLAGYPQVNEQSENALRYALNSISGMTPEQARVQLRSLNNEHSIRREWVWARLGESALANALLALTELAEGTEQLPVGTSPEELASHYARAGWQVDDAVLRAMASVVTVQDTQAVAAAIRTVYTPWLHACAERLQTAVQQVGGLTGLPEPLPADKGSCTVFIDGLRFDVAKRLQARLEKMGDVKLSAHWTSLPSVTASGKAWCSPVKSLISGLPDNTDFEPAVASDGKPLTAHHFRRVLSEQNVQVLDKTSTGDASGQAWVEAGDLDHYGHEHGVRLAKDMDAQLDRIVERIEQLVTSGWARIRVVTDHGWLLLPGGLPKSELAKHQTETRWGRCAVLKASAHATELTFPWSWCADVHIAYAPGVSSFVAGAEYAHGGISMQECLVPMIELQSVQTMVTQTVTIEHAVWKGLRCVVTVAEQLPNLRADIRTKPALAETSVLAQPKAVVDGQANVAVVDPDLDGSAAVIVILDAQGQVLQRLATTIGG